MDIDLDIVEELVVDRELQPVPLTDDTIGERLDKVIKRMSDKNLDAIVVYCDLEHGGNFEYLTGFVTRFEEGMLVLHKTKEAYLILGNENLNKVSKSRIKAKGIHMPHLSLANQPMDNDNPITNYFKEARLSNNMQVGVVGWKLFTSHYCDNNKLFDLPNFLIQGLKEVVDEKNLSNQTGLFISSDNGARVTNNSNEIAHYEFWAQLSSQSMSKGLQTFDVGISEMEIGDVMQELGQPRSVVTIAATGERFEKANMYPTNKKVTLGDPVSMTVGYKGGLTSRAGYAVSTTKQLPTGVEDYLDVLAKPYFNAIATWLETIKIGMTGHEMYSIIEDILPQKTYGWHLNPGHLFADEEWLSSPIYPTSDIILKSGMMFQTDIIPSMAGYAGTSCESGIVLADSALQRDIKKHYADLYETFMIRRKFIENQLNIKLSEDVLPMTDTVAYYRPFFLNKKQAFKRMK
ncbi:hypothetical protein G314FT_12660 [Vagococcus luciliae]|uniref:Xaa-Pro aminopeptidase n=1 Tax=Vagococcus luciliae TaxID=2920380 RepID=A0ABY5NZL5_9ENTE|nr:hypothetical protein G314FT_12660 [Vagococcus luciliae]